MLRDKYQARKSYKNGTHELTTKKPRLDLLNDIWLPISTTFEERRQ
jgi:hypothetical protein